MVESLIEPGSHSFNRLPATFSPDFLCSVISQDHLILLAFALRYIFLTRHARTFPADALGLPNIHLYLA